MELDEILTTLKSLANHDAVEGMARYGISSEGTLGVSIPSLRKIAKQAGKDHELAAKLWSTGIHEARILAAFVDDPAKVTVEQMDSWAADFDSWDVCDQCCCDLFYRSEFAWRQAAAWSSRDEEFVKRAAFALMAGLAWHDKTAPDSKLKKFLPVIKRESVDERNFVKKAVSWALRNIGKRNIKINRAAIKTAEEIAKKDYSRSARWISRDVLRELTGDAVQKRLLAAAGK
ncbi:MAG: DNA alkylation repair protein [Thermoleophilia bacterium]